LLITPSPFRYHQIGYTGQGRNQRWSFDFVSDAFARGRRFRIFAVVHDFTRECVLLIPDTSISGPRVAREWTV
jgi:putative transposase